MTRRNDPGDHRLDTDLPPHRIQTFLRPCNPPPRQRFARASVADSPCRDPVSGLVGGPQPDFARSDPRGPCRTSLRDSQVPHHGRGHRALYQPGFGDGGRSADHQGRRMLRAFRLNELPQVPNVVKGGMSLVDPHPERPDLMCRFSRELPEFSQLLRVRPGIAGLAQARKSYHAQVRDKLRYDNLYIAGMNPLLDLKLIALCVWVSIRVRARQ